MEVRFSNAIEVILFSLLVVAVFYVLALLVNLVFKKKIGTQKYYVVAIILGFLLHRGLMSVQNNSPKNTASSNNHIAQVTNNKSGLDVQFIVPSEAELEKFPVQLEQAIQKLTPQERAIVKQAIEFLTFSIIANLMENQSDELAQMSDTDLASKSLVKLYRFAQKNGSSMTLRKYIELSEEFKKQKPDWWEQYQLQSKNQ